jgi:hypothetical protein
MGRPIRKRILRLRFSFRRFKLPILRSSKSEAGPRRPKLETRRVNVDFPAWVVAGLDRQAKRLGVTRQALIKMWIAERVG